MKTVIGLDRGGRWADAGSDPDEAQTEEAMARVRKAQQQADAARAKPSFWSEAFKGTNLLLLGAAGAGLIYLFSQRKSYKSAKEYLGRNVFGTKKK